MLYSNDKYWIPEIDKNNLNNKFLYNIDIYENIFVDIYKILKSGLSMSQDIEDENIFVDEKKYNDGLKYIRIKTKTNNETIFIPISIGEEDYYSEIMYDNQNHKVINFNIYEKEIEKESKVTIIFTNDEHIFISPETLKIINSFRSSHIKNEIIDAFTDKILENRSRVRKK